MAGAGRNAVLQGSIIGAVGDAHGFTGHAFKRGNRTVSDGMGGECEEQHRDAGKAMGGANDRAGRLHDRFSFSR